jgi:hypothetical protein
MYRLNAGRDISISKIHQKTAETGEKRPKIG